MKITVIYDGRKYESAESNEVNSETIVNQMYQNFESLESLKLSLKDGGTLLMGKGAVQSCVLIFEDT